MEEIVSGGNQDKQCATSSQNHCRQLPVPYHLDTSCFGETVRLHPLHGEELYFSWADRERVTALAAEAWALVAPFMNGHSERLVPVPTSSKLNGGVSNTLIRITHIDCGYRIERFQQAIGQDGWPVTAHIGGLTLQGPCSANPLKPVYIGGVKPGSLRPVDMKEEIIEELRSGINVVRAMPHAVHITHGHHQVNLLLGDLYPDTGGQNEYINKFARTMARLGCRSTVFNRGGYLAGPNDPHSGWEWTSDASVGVIRMEDSMSALWQRKEDMAPFADALAYDAAQWLCGEKVDVLFTHYWDAAVEAAYLRRMLKLDCRIVFVPHSLGEHKRINELKIKEKDPEKFDQVRFDNLHLEERTRHEQEMLDQEIDLVASTSDELTNLLINHYNYPKERIRTLAPGYDDDVYHPVPREARWVPTDPAWQEFAKEILRVGQFPDDKDVHWLQYEALFITEVSRTDETKNKGLILKAMDMVSRINPNVVLLINIASGERNSLGKELRAQLAELRHNNPNLMVAAFERPSDDFVAKMHAVAKMYVTASTQEGFGMSVLNAAASGKPSIFTNCVPFGNECLLGSTPKVISTGVMQGEGGVLVDVGSAQALSEGILHLLRSRTLRKAMGEAAFKKALPFSWTECTLSFLRSIDCLNAEGKIDFSSLKNFPRRQEGVH